MHEPALPSRRHLFDQIDRLAISADAKVLLGRVANTDTTIAGRVVEVGRRILAFAFETIKMFPNTTFGMVIGFTMSLLVGSVAVLGMVFGPVLGPLLIALGLGVGAIADMQDGALRAHIAKLEREFGAIAHG